MLNYKMKGHGKPSSQIHVTVIFTGTLQSTEIHKEYICWILHRITIGNSNSPSTFCGKFYEQLRLKENIVFWIPTLGRVIFQYILQEKFSANEFNEESCFLTTTTRDSNNLVFFMKNMLSYQISRKSTFYHK